MALNHNIVEIRQQYGRWIVLCDITDDVTGKIYNCRWQFREAVTESSQAVLDQIAKVKLQITRDAELADNSLNLTTDEDRLLEYYRKIKIDIILRIRLYPAATLQQASDYISGKYPDSPFAFANLYLIWLKITGCANWSEFKVFCINRKFEGID